MDSPCAYFRRCFKFVSVKIGTPYLFQEKQRKCLWHAHTQPLYMKTSGAHWHTLPFVSSPFHFVFSLLLPRICKMLALGFAFGKLKSKKIHNRNGSKLYAWDGVCDWTLCSSITWWPGGEETVIANEMLSSCGLELLNMNELCNKLFRRNKQEKIVVYGTV